MSVLVSTSWAGAQQAVSGPAFVSQPSTASSVGARALDTPELFGSKPVEVEPTFAISVSDSASGFESAHFASAKRHCPDLVGMMGPYLVPVEPHCALDRNDRDPDGGPRDGWAAVRGTSLAAAQVAGVVAQLLQKHPSLTPDACKNILFNSTDEVSAGLGAQGEAASSGWDPASGWGARQQRGGARLAGNRRLPALHADQPARHRGSLSPPRDGMVEP